MKKKNVKPDINFFFEKTLQRHNPRGIFSKPERGKFEGDPTYYILDYLSRKKKISVEDLWEMKNPSARLAKAAMSLKYTRREPADLETHKDYGTLNQLQHFMLEIGLWSKDEVQHLADKDNDNSEDEDIGEIQKTLREAIFTKIQKTTDFHEAFDKLTRVALASHLKAAYLEAPEPKDCFSHHHSKSTKLDGHFHPSHETSKDFKSYIQNTSNKDKIAYSSQQFISSLLSVYRDPIELLGLEPGTSRLKELKEVLLELYGKEVVEELFDLNTPILTRPESGNASSKKPEGKIESATSEKNLNSPRLESETIFENKIPGEQLVKEALSDIKKLEKDTLKHLQEVNKTNFEENSRIKRIFQKSKQDFYLKSQFNQQSLQTAETQAGDSRPNQSELRSKKKTEHRGTNSIPFNKNREEDPLRKLLRQKILDMMQTKVDQADRYDPRIAESIKLAFKKQLEAQE